MKTTAMNLRSEVRYFILNDVKASLMRLGINANFTMETEKDYRGDDYLTIKSSRFQTMPVIFKELWIEGVVSVYDVEDTDKVGVTVRISYYWESFGGGSNGTDLGTVRYVVDKNMPGKISQDSVRYYVCKQNGLEI